MQHDASADGGYGGRRGGGGVPMLNVPRLADVPPISDQDDRGEGEILPVLDEHTSPARKFKGPMFQNDSPLDAGVLVNDADAVTAVVGWEQTGAGGSGRKRRNNPKHTTREPIL